MALYLHVAEPRLFTRVFRLDDPCQLRIGRNGDSDICLDNGYVSRRHAVLDFSDGRASIVDRGSLNGTRVDRARITGQAAVESGSVITIARTSLYILPHPGLDEEGYANLRAVEELMWYLPADGANRRLHLLADVLREGWAGRLPVAPPVRLSRDAIDEVLRLLLLYRGVSHPRAAPIDLARDVLGDFFRPFRPDADWLSRDGWNARLLADEIRRTGDYSALPVLADALEEAGCSEETVLRHCRQESVHTRGCWVLEGLLRAGEQKPAGPARPLTIPS